MPQPPKLPRERKYLQMTIRERSVFREQCFGTITVVPLVMSHGCRPVDDVNAFARWALEARRGQGVAQSRRLFRRVARALACCMPPALRGEATVVSPDPFPSGAHPRR